MKAAKTKIVISNYDDLANPYYGGGGAVAVHQVAKRLAVNAQVTVLTGKYPGSKTQVVDGVFYKRIGWSGFGPRAGQLAFLAALPFYLKRQDFDLWLESLTPPFSTAFLPLFTDKPVIGLVHMLTGKDMRRKYKLPFDLLEAVGLARYRYFIVVSDQQKEELSRLNDTAKVEVIPNGVELGQNGPKAGVKKEYILFIGRIEVDQKGLDLLLRAYGRISDKIDQKLIIAGGGTARETNRLQKLISQLGLESRVDLLGKIGGQEKSAAFEKSLFVVVPSRFETFSIVALEAFSYGLPLVSFDINGLGWIPATICRKVTPFDEAALAREILRLIEDGTLREKMGRQSREFVKSYSWDRASQKYQAFFLNVLQSSREVQP